MKYRVAICLSGFMRTFDKCYQSLLDNIINCNPNFEFDFFIHTYSNYPKEVEDIIDKIKPKKIVIEDYDECKHLFTDDFFYKNPYHDSLTSNYFKLKEKTLSMFYKIYHSNNIKILFEKENNFIYDYCIRIRPDLFFNQNILLDNIDNNFIYINSIVFDNVKSGTIIFNDMGLCNDQFSISSSKNIDLYSSVYLNINSDTFLHQETMLYQTIKNFPIKYEDFNFFILR